MNNPPASNLEEALKAVFVQGTEAWNRRDLDGYLALYADGEHVRWVSSGKAIIGKAKIRNALEPRFASTAGMGKLAIKELQIDIQTPSDALVYGAWGLIVDRQEVSGVFTVHLQHIAGRWLIVSDHASVLE